MTDAQRIFDYRLSRKNMTDAQRILDYRLSRKNMTDAQRIFDYRLSRKHRVTENAFGILANRFRVFPV